jgi:hypothetical protein
MAAAPPRPHTWSTGCRRSNRSIKDQCPAIEIILLGTLRHRGLVRGRLFRQPLELRTLDVLAARFPLSSMDPSRRWINRIAAAPFVLRA